MYMQMNELLNSHILNLWSKQVKTNQDLDRIRQ